MNTKNCFITILCSIALIACFAGAGPDAHAQGIGVSTYELTDLGTFPEQKIPGSTATAINSAGEVSGISGKFAFCYDRREKEPMEKLSGSVAGISRAFAMNDYDQMVGDSTFGGKRSVSRAALFYKGSVIDLGALDNGNFFRNTSRANGINSSGQVVGFSGPILDGSNSRAFLWSQATGMFDIGTLGGAYAQAFAINDGGFVTGSSQLKSKVGAVHAFIYDSLGLHIGPFWGMRDLGTLGGTYSYGMSINGKNTVVGYSTIDKSNDRIHAFILDKSGKMRDLGSLGGKTLQNDQSFALGVNGADEVVGYTYLPAKTEIKGPRQVAFIFTKGAMINLNDLIGSAAESYLVQSAVAINDNGQIAANAVDYLTGNVHAVLLTPTGMDIDVDTD